MQNNVESNFFLVLYMWKLHSIKNMGLERKFEEKRLSSVHNIRSFIGSSLNITYEFDSKVFIAAMKLK